MSNVKCSSTHVGSDGGLQGTFGHSFQTRNRHWCLAVSGWTRNLDMLTCGHSYAILSLRWAWAGTEGSSFPSCLAHLFWLRIKNRTCDQKILPSWNVHRGKCRIEDWGRGAISCFEQFSCTQKNNISHKKYSFGANLLSRGEIHPCVHSDLLLQTKI